VDIGTVRKETRSAEDTVSCFYVEADGSLPKSEVKASIEQTFGNRAVGAWEPSGTGLGNPLGELFKALDRQLRPTLPAPAPTAVTNSTGEITPEESSVEVRSAEDWADRFDEFSEDLNLFLMVMTTVGVVIAVLSIVNTMLMSVTERTIDFGILRANGWRTRDILLLITYESAAIGLVGGIFGAICGWLVTLFVNWNWPDRMQLFASPPLLAFSLLFSVVMGIVGGLYPAWLASRMSPMDAIRRG
jgi:putative ABC transport system permease protein